MSSNKRCTSCQTAKPTKSFNVARNRKDGLQTVCRECNAERCKKYYRDNKSEHRKRVRGDKKKYIERNRNMVLDHLLINPCVDCGESNPLRLTNDHVRGVKKDHISRLVTQGAGVKTLKVELSKCEVRCASCHLERTAVSRGWWMVEALKLRAIKTDTGPKHW